MSWMNVAKSYGDLFYTPGQHFDLHSSAIRLISSLIFLCTIVVSPLLNSFMPIMSLITYLRARHCKLEETKITIVLLTVSPSEFKVIMGLTNPYP